MAEIIVPKELLPDSTFTCGPSQGHPDIRNAKISDTPFERSHRSPDVTKNGLYSEATENFKKLYSLPDDYKVIFVSGGATYAMDTVAWNLSDDSISGLLLGSFSKLWGQKIGNQLPDDIKRTLISPKDDEQFPSELPDLNSSLVFLTPNETSMGISIPDDYLADIYDKVSDDTIVAWDCTSCAGGRNLPIDKFDVMVFSMQKCFGVGGGTGVIVMSPKAVAKYNSIAGKRKKPYTVDLKEMLKRATEKIQTLNTPSTINIWMFNEAIKWMNNNGGIIGMDNLVRKHFNTLAEWVNKNDNLKFWVKDERFRSKITVTIEFDSSTDTTELNKILAAQGKSNLRDGIKKYSAMKDNACRIACFPFIDINGSEQFDKLIKTVEYISEGMKVY